MHCDEIQVKIAKKLE